MDKEKTGKIKGTRTIVERKYVGELTPIQAILPIVLEDLKKRYEENRKIEKEKNNN